MMATTELQAPYTDVETVERSESSGSVLEMKEADSRSSDAELQNEHFMSNSSASNPKSKFANLRNDIDWLKGVEIIVLSGIILVVWALFAIPTFIYALTNKQGPVVSQPDLCEQPVAYNGEVCFSELRYWQQCFSQQAATASADIYLPSNIDPKKVENTAMSYFFRLPILSPSRQCETDLKPFLCLYLFGSCDLNNQSHHITQADCERLRDRVCAREWALAESFLGTGVLPQCGDFSSQEEVSCREPESIVNGTAVSLDYNNISTNGSNTMCAENYYITDDGLCMPLCSLWVDPLHGASFDANNIAILISVVTAVLSAIILLIISLSVQRKFMWRFPTFYLNYVCITVAAIALPILIGFMVNDRERLFCSSKDLITVFLRESTHFCTFAGVMLAYGLVQLVLWITFHAISLCWGILFPFHFRQMKLAKKLKYIHISTVLVALLLPIIPALLLLLKDGYVIIDTPTTFCAGRSPEFTFYALILPLSILLAIATSAFIIMLWIIMKEFVLKKLVEGKRPQLIGKAQAKILFIMCYYIITAIIALTVFVNFEVKGASERQKFQEYFICQSAGMQEGSDCGESIDERLQEFTVLGAVSIILIGLLPAVILAFSVKCVKCKTKKAREISRKSSTFTVYVDFSKEWNV